MSRVYVYKITDSENRIRYVGKTLPGVTIELVVPSGAPVLEMKTLDSTTDLSC